MKKILAAGCAFLFMTTLAHRAAADDFSASLKVSTLGPGVEVQEKFGSNLGLRLDANYLPITTNFTVDSVRYKADFSWKNVSLLADFYPFSGIFRLTGGVFYNGNTVDVTGAPSGTVQIGDHSYSAADVGTISGSLEFNKIVPYAGFGWSGGSTASGDWTISIDIGIMFQGAPSVSNLTASGLLGSSSAFSSDLDKERADIKDEMDSYQYYPVVALGLAYHF